MSDRFAIINVFSEMNLVLFFYHDERDLGFIPISIRRQKLMELKITQSSKSQKNIWAAAWTSLFVLKRLKFSKLLSLWQVLFRSLFLSNLNPCENPILKECKSPSLIFNKLLSFINLKWRIQKREYCCTSNGVRICRHIFFTAMWDVIVERQFLSLWKKQYLLEKAASMRICLIASSHLLLSKLKWKSAQIMIIKDSLLFEAM